MLIHGVTMMYLMLNAWRSVILMNTPSIARNRKPVIPNRSNRKQPFSFSKRLYKLRWCIESAFNRLKDFMLNRHAFDRLARNYLASVCHVAALVWWI